MAYELSAVIAAEQVLRTAALGLPAARTAALGRGLSLLPMTEALFHAVADGRGRGAAGFREVPEGFDRVLAGWSAGGPVAYVEAEYFGGAGEQRAAVWEGGSLVLGPLRIEEGEPFPPAGSPVSRALRRLGITARPGEDEFATAGLHRHRNTGDWVA
ncbi:hypothetical protein ACIP3D_21240 [Streptomyces longwoodensis]|uniref:hypothetical protein n=1 Tax=Streptomyces longwoodensis TaxID=68231 RepID=UPI00382F9924